MRPLETAARRDKDAPDLGALLEDIARFETIVAAWDDNQRAAAIAYAKAVETLHGEALKRLIGALKPDPAAIAALKNAVADDVVYAVLRRHRLLKPSLNERVEAALESIRPALASHGGDVALVRIDPPVIDVRFTGACDGCSASQLTFQAGVRKAVREACPEITDIRQVKGTGASQAHFESPFAAQATGEWLPAGNIGDIPDGGVRALALKGANLLLARSGETVTCYTNACAHMGYELSGGETANGILACPHHGFAYDLSTGACLTAPELALRAHAARVTEGRVEIRVSK